MPLGRLADRVGRLRVFLGGYVLLLVLYGALLVPALGPAALVGCVLLFGAYYAATDGVLMALASPLLPSEVRGSGLALVTTGTTLSRLVGSLAFGALWTFAGLEPAVVVFAAGLLLALAATAVLARRIARTSHA